MRRATSASIAGGHRLDAGLELLAREQLGAQRLERERDVHDAGGVALRGGEVDDLAAGEQVEAAAVG